MTEEKAIEFAKLELTYMTKVTEEDTGEQARLMELIFFWIEREIVVFTLSSLSSLGVTAPPETLPKLNEQQRADFVSFQIALLQAFNFQNKEAANKVEREMKDWIDKQCEDAAAATMAPHVKPKFQIVRGGQGQ
jgi:hypothetical protein